MSRVTHNMYGSPLIRPQEHFFTGIRSFPSICIGNWKRYVRMFGQAVARSHSSCAAVRFCVVRAVCVPKPTSDTEKTASGMHTTAPELHTTLCPIPCTPRPIPSTLYPVPYALYNLHLLLYTIYPIPYTLYHLPFTLHPKPFAIYHLPCPIPYHL